MSKCLGCGIILQDKNRDIPGYVQDLSFKYCERCFRNVNYSEIKEQELDITNQDIIEKINHNSSLTFFIVDFLNINNDLIKLYLSISSHKYLVVNKTDILPKSLSYNKITKLFAEEYHVTEKIIFTSVKNNNLINYFDNYQNIYFCGLSNSGKTSLVAKITGNQELTKSSMLNTTMDYLTIKHDKYNIIDCPGFILKSNNIESKYLKLINPNKVIKIRNYQLKNNTTLNIHDLFKITFIDSNNVSCYLSNGLLVKKEYHDIESYLKLDIPNNSDLIIKGIGFLNIKENGSIKVPNDLEYEIRKSIF